MLLNVNVTSKSQVTRVLPGSLWAGASEPEPAVSVKRAVALCASLALARAQPARLATSD